MPNDTATETKHHSDRSDSWANIDVILPPQLHADVHAVVDPERRLRLAVLDDAIRYFQSYEESTSRDARALYEDAVDWIASPDRSEPFSFENVCVALDLDPDYVRAGLYRWRLARRAGLARPLPRLVGRRTRPRPRPHGRRAA